MEWAFWSNAHAAELVALMGNLARKDWQKKMLDGGVSDLVGMEIQIDLFFGLDLFNGFEILSSRR
ncbi:hypothetical protein V2J09_014725 [Rumex salicifolius]